MVIVSAVGLSVLIPAIAFAQMGKGMDSGTRRGMQGRSDPRVQTREMTPPTKDTREEKTRATTDMPEMMVHPAASLPFYQERTFLVLVGLATAAGGFAIYWAMRARWRRMLGSARFVTEAVFVVDLVESTHLATHYGDGVAMQARATLKDRAMEVAKAHGLIFAESTGDGYFMTFASVVDAVQTVLGLLKDLRDRPPNLSMRQPLEIRAGITYGQILLDNRDARHGAAINKAFRLVSLSRESFVPLEGEGELGEIPDRNRIFLDEEAAHELVASKPSLISVGFCNLKGFSGLHRVFAVSWRGE